MWSAAGLAVAHHGDDGERLERVPRATGGLPPRPLPSPDVAMQLAPIASEIAAVAAQPARVIPALVAILPQLPHVAAEIATVLLQLLPVPADGRRVAGLQVVLELPSIASDLSPIPADVAAIAAQLARFIPEMAAILPQIPHVAAETATVLLRLLPVRADGHRVAGLQIVPNLPAIVLDVSTVLPDGPPFLPDVAAALFHIRVRLRALSPRGSRDHYDGQRPTDNAPCDPVHDPSLEIVWLSGDSRESVHGTYQAAGTAPGAIALVATR